VWPFAKVNKKNSKVQFFSFRSFTIQKQITSEINQFFLLQRYILGKIFMKIRSVVLCEVANRQTERQTNARNYITALAEVIKQYSKISALFEKGNYHR